jgi:hypothetical protein
VEDLLASIISDALDQAAGLLELDAIRAEVWASDLTALAAETGPDGISRLIAALVDAGGPAAAAALWAVHSMVDGVDPDNPALEPAPAWVDDLRSSTCEAAWLLEERRGVSAALRFVDRADDRHVVIVDLVPAGDGGEKIGEVAVGPPDLLDALDEPGSGIAATEVAPPELAKRIARAGRSTSEPTSSYVANARLLLARLSSLGIDDLEAPIWIEPEVPELPAPDPDADAWAVQVLDQALGDTGTPGPEAVAAAAAVLRTAAGSNDRLAQWLAASEGPIDLDEPDLVVVLSALAAAISPARLAPLAADARRAVLELEWADWLGAVIGIVRAGAGVSVDPDGLVDQINRCQEVTSTIPKADRGRVAWAFEVIAETWEPLGIAVDDTLTEFGSRVLPLALRTAWSAKRQKPGAEAPGP